MSGNLNKREEINRVFARALPLIDAALVSQYGLPQNEAMEVEQCLHEWFVGFARRPASPQPEDQLRPFLILMACQAGHIYWSSKSEAPRRDENVKRSLALGPQRIALEIEERLKNREEADASRSQENGETDTAPRDGGEA